MKPRAKPIRAVATVPGDVASRHLAQYARDRIANDVAKGHLTIDQAHAELDRLERPPGVPLSKPGTLQQTVQEFASKIDRVPPEIRALSGAPSLVEKPACFEARTYPLRHEVTERMDAITMRCLREAVVVG